VHCGIQATAPDSGFFPPILSRHGRDAPPGLRIFLFSFHLLDRKKTPNLEFVSNFDIRILNLLRSGERK
jgi:hypothetical protein